MHLKHCCNIVYTTPNKFLASNVGRSGILTTLNGKTYIFLKTQIWLRNGKWLSPLKTLEEKERFKIPGGDLSTNINSKKDFHNFMLGRKNKNEIFR